MPLRDWILAALLATAGALFSVGAGLVWNVGVALMVGAVLLAGWGWLLFTGEPDVPVEATVEDVE